MNSFCKNAIVIIFFAFASFGEAAEMATEDVIRESLSRNAAFLKAQEVEDKKYTPPFPVQVSTWIAPLVNAAAILTPALLSYLPISDSASFYLTGAMTFGLLNYQEWALDEKMKYFDSAIRLLEQMDNYHPSFWGEGRLGDSSREDYLYMKYLELLAICLSEFSNNSWFSVITYCGMVKLVGWETSIRQKIWNRRKDIKNQQYNQFLQQEMAVLSQHVLTIIQPPLIRLGW